MQIGFNQNIRNYPQFGAVIRGNGAGRVLTNMSEKNKTKFEELEKSQKENPVNIELHNNSKDYSKLRAVIYAPSDANQSIESREQKWFQSYTGFLKSCIKQANSMNAKYEAQKEVEAYVAKRLADQT